MDLSLLFAGTAASVPSPRRGLPSLLIRRGGERLLMDCGEGTQRQLARSVGLTELDAVYLTHFHGDHWFGLPGMLRSFAMRDREHPLQVFGPPGLRALFERMRFMVGRLSYPLEVIELEAGDQVDYDGYAIHAFNVRHRGIAFGYALVEDDRPGRFDDARARALGVAFGPDFGRLQRGEAVGEVRPEMVVGPVRRGRRLVYSGDTAPCEMLRDAAAGADVLVHEATFTHQDLERAQLTRHSTAAQAATLAAEAEVGLLALTHVSGRYHPRELLDEARAIFPGAVVARDFDLVEVPLPEKGEPAVVSPGADRPRASVGEP